METLLQNKIILIVRQVNPIFIHTIWAQVESMLEKALEHSSGEYNVDQLKVFLVQGLQTLLVAEDDGKIYGAATISFENYPNDRIAFMTAIGGKMIASKSCWEQFCNWAKANGCTKVRGAAFEEVARLWHQRFGVESVYIIVEKKL